MKRLSYIFSLLLVMVVLLCNCSDSYEVYENSFESTKADGSIRVEAYATGLGEIDASRAAKDAFDTRIGTLYMLVFDGAGNIVGSPQFSVGAHASFVIDRLNDPAYVNHPNKSLLESCIIYMVANLENGDLDHITTLDELLDYEIVATTIHPNNISNFRGLVMFGSSSVMNLSPEATGIASVTQIWMESIYSKVQVKVKVDAVQVTEGYIPQFQMTSWQLFNAPTLAKFRKPETNEPTEFVENTTQVYMDLAPEVDVVGQNPVTHGVDSLMFTFYVLEHKVNPHNVDGETKEYKSYPDGITQKDKQRFKPLLCDATQRPMYVVLNGVYTDHQGIDKVISYKIYLGANNYDDFYILRNTQYNNTITIMGTTNHNLAQYNSISFDHRVHIERDSYWIEMEREVILDSHIEVRPIDIEFSEAAVAKGTGRVEIAFVDPEQVLVDRDNPKFITRGDTKYQWARMEKKSKATTPELNRYCSNGKRKYFTPTLMSELNTEAGIKSIISVNDFKNDNNRVWLYFDENLYASKDGQRDCMLLLSYYDSDSDTQPDYEYFAFHQHDLFPVEYGGKKYYIEYNEEYLYNFDPKDNFGITTDGMSWGGVGVISDSLQAFENASGLAGSSWFSYIEEIMQANGGYYDFKDNYTGHDYTKNLVNKSLTTILSMADLPRSAAEYCYNKNKRDANGNVTSATYNWYLPAIGEIQDIARGAYNVFRVFQNHWYWSSQTSYGNGHFDYYSFGSSWRTGYGDFKYEHEQMARATKVEYLGNDQYDYAPSEVTGDFGRVLKCTSLIFGYGIESSWDIRDNDLNNIPSNIKMDAGNKKRSEIHRVRAVRRNNGDIIER